MKDGKPEVLIIGERHPASWYRGLEPTKTISIRLGNESFDISVPDIENLKFSQSAFLFALFAHHTIKKEIAAIRRFRSKKLLFELPDEPATRKLSEIFLQTKDIESFHEELIKYIIHKNADVSKKVNNMILDFIKKSGSSSLEFDRTVSSALQLIFDSRKKLPPSIVPAKIISFIVQATKIYNIGFLDNPAAHASYCAFIDLHAFVSELLKMVKQYNFPKENVAAFERIINDLWLATIERVGEEQNKKREKLLAENAAKMIIDRTVIICGADHVDALTKKLRKSAYLHKPVILK